MARPPLTARDRALRWTAWAGYALFCAAFWACVGYAVVWLWP